MGSTVDVGHLLNGHDGGLYPCGSTSCLPGISPHALCMGTVNTQWRSKAVHTMEIQASSQIGDPSQLTQWIPKELDDEDVLELELYESPSGSSASSWQIVRPSFVKY